MDLDLLEGLPSFMPMKGSNLMENPALCVKPWLRGSPKAGKSEETTGPAGLWVCPCHLRSPWQGSQPGPEATQAR